MHGWHNAYLKARNIEARSGHCTPGRCRMRVRAVLPALVFLIAPLAGCLSDDSPPTAPDFGPDTAPSLDYLMQEPDLDMVLEEFDQFLPGEGVEIHIRVVKPAGPGPFPVISQFTPYTAPGQNVIVDGLAEPAVATGCRAVPDTVTTPATPLTNAFDPADLARDVACGQEGRFDLEFVRRGYAFAYGDVRGTGDSTGCLDLRGAGDIADLWHLTEWLGTQSWSNGNVGFIGASYPGSEAHMAALAGNPHLKAVVPVVASTSFYHYHHNGGVPYSGQHSIGGTNAGYTQDAVSPTVNPQASNFGTRYVEETQCTYDENVLDHGGLDQSGAYYEWWQERNLRARASTVNVPVLMAQGLADWNVKPDHIATWFNEIPGQKTLIAGQWAHAYPYSICPEGETRAACDNAIPYGNWWGYAAAFFDTFLKEIDTGMFTENVAWVQDTTGEWHRSSTWPIIADDVVKMPLFFRADGTLSDTPETSAATLSWYGCPDNQQTYQQSIVNPTSTVRPCEAPTGTVESLVFESAPFESDVIVSGTPYVHLDLTIETTFTHLTVLVEVLDAGGEKVQRTVRETVPLTDRENYGYLNPTFRGGLMDPKFIEADAPYSVQIDLFPQEDVIKAGERLRVTIASDDAGRSIESYDAGANTILLGPDNHNGIHLPLRPDRLMGTRLAE